MTRRLLYIICGALILVFILSAVVTFMLVPTFMSAVKPQPTPQPTAAVATPARNALGTILRQYGPAVNTQVANGLKLTPEELTTQLHSGKTLTAIATTQHVSLTQLQTLIATSLQT